jgi:CelD/BcsL family acetyltransferase involved in cellulose biosynthesis
VRPARRRELRARIVPISALTASDLEKWRSLAPRALEPNPMCEPPCVLAAARNLPYGDDLALLVADDGECFHIVTPVFRVPRFGRLPFPVVTTDIRRMTWLGTPLLGPERPVEAWMSALTTLSTERRSGRWQGLALKWIADGPVAAALDEATRRLRLPTYVSEDFDQPFLHRRPDRSYTSNQSKRHLGDYRRRARRLSELLGAELEVENVAADLNSVREYVELEAAGYKVDNGVAMRTQDGESEYFTEMCAAFAAEGRLQVLKMHAGGRTVSMQISFEAGDGLFLVKVGHDEKFNHYDPGVQLHFAAMEHFDARTDAAWIDVCTFPDNDLLLRLYQDRRRTKSVLVGLGGPLNSAMVRAIPHVRRAGHRSRRLVRAARHAVGPKRGRS